MDEEGKEQHQVKGNVMGFLLDTDDARRPERRFLYGAVIPWEKAELE